MRTQEIQYPRKAGINKSKTLKEMKTQSTKEVTREEWRELGFTLEKDYFVYLRRWRWRQKSKRKGIRIGRLKIWLLSRVEMKRKQPRIIRVYDNKGTITESGRSLPYDLLFVSFRINRICFSFYGKGDSEHAAAL